MAVSILPAVAYTYTQLLQQKKKSADFAQLGLVRVRSCRATHVYYMYPRVVVRAFVCMVLIYRYASHVASVVAVMCESDRCVSPARLYTPC